MRNILSQSGLVRDKPKKKNKVDMGGDNKSRHPSQRDIYQREIRNKDVPKQV